MLLNTILLNEPNGGGFQGIIMIVALIAIFYFFMIRPQQKRQKEIRQFRENIAKGDTVVTAGGIYGKVRDISEKYFLIEVSDGVRIRVDKGSVYPSANDANAAAQENNQNK